MRKAIALTLTMVMAVTTMTACGKSTVGEVTLGEYKGLEVYESDLDTDFTFETTKSSILSSKASEQKVEEGKVEETDTVNIDYVGSLDGFEFEGGTGSAYDLDIDNNTFIDGFAKGLIGKKVGETVDLNLKFPDDYANTTKDADGNELSLAGKDVLFKVTINYRTANVTPEYTDAFVKENFKSIGTTTAEMDEYLKRRLAISAAMSAVWEDFLESCEVVSYVDAEVESYQSYINDNNAMTLQAYYGTDIQTYLEACSMSQSEWDDEMKSNAQKVMKQKMIVDEIVTKEGIKITADSKNYKKLARQLAQLNGIDTVKMLEQNYGREAVLEQLNLEAVQAFIYDNLKINTGEKPSENSETTAAAE